MKLRNLIFAGIIVVLFCACGTEQPVTDPGQIPEITMEAEKGGLTSVPEGTAVPEITVTPEATLTPAATLEPTVTPEPATTPASTVTPAPTTTPEPSVSPAQTELAEHLRIAHKDEISAELAENGYWHEVGETYTDGIFTFDFKAVTGDMHNPLLIIDVTVADETLAAAHDKLTLFAYILDEELYDNDLESYGPREGEGIKDESVENLYHVTMPGNPYWMIGGASFVTDICKVNFGTASDTLKSYPVEVPEYRLMVPSHKFYPILKKGYDGCVFTFKGKEYYLETIDYGRYGTEVSFGVYADREDVSVFPEGAYQYTLSVQPEWKEFLENLTLEADGEVYRISGSGFRVYRESVLDRGDYYGGGSASFCGIDFAEVSDLKLWLGTQGYDLKSDEDELLYREQQVPAPEKGQVELSFHLRKYHQDEISASLVEEGYFYLVEETKNDSLFQFDLIALTGDLSNRKMVIDVTVDESVMTGMHDIIYLCVGAYSEGRYEPNVRSWNSEGYGIRDKENENLYHVIMDNEGADFGSVVINICRVGLGSDPADMSGSVWFNVSPGEFLLDVPEKTYASVFAGDYESLVFNYGESEYELGYTTFGNYQSEMGFYTMIDAEKVPEEEDAQKKYMEERRKEWLEFADTLVLTVDGKEYTVTENEDKRGEIRFFEIKEESVYRGSVFPQFPTFDYKNASEIELKSGNTVYRLK